MNMLYRCYLLYSTLRPTVCNIHKYVPVRVHTSNICMETLYLLWAETGTESTSRCWMFSKDLASAYVLCHQTSSVLIFQMRVRWGFRGSDKEFEEQSMLISDWRTYQGSENWAYIRVRVWRLELEQGERKCEVKQKHETHGGMEFRDGWVNRIIIMTDGTDDQHSPMLHSLVCHHWDSAKVWDMT